MPLGHGPQTRPSLQIHRSRSIYAAPTKVAIRFKDGHVWVAQHNLHFSQKKMYKGVKVV